MASGRSRQGRCEFLLLISLTMMLNAFSLSCASRSLDARDASINESSARENSRNVVALIGTNAEPYSAFDIAAEAVNVGKANFLVFPEWGFLPDTKPITEDQINRWNRFAVSSRVTILVGARERGRNTILIFEPNGSIKRALRRDGQNSPKPTLESELAPVVFVTRDQLRIGVLICDESRIRSFFEPMARERLDALLVPNNVGSPAFESDLLALYRRLEPNFDFFVGDRFQQDSSVNFTHVYRADNGTLELNSFGNPVKIGKDQNKKTSDAGITYSISYHPLILKPNR
jgi:hypothetical protein